eukprot:ANDGO_02370.mRNA.1 hypothetical protein
MGLAQCSSTHDARLTRHIHGDVCQIHSCLAFHDNLALICNQLSVPLVGMIRAVASIVPAIIILIKAVVVTGLVEAVMAIMTATMMTVAVMMAVTVIVIVIVIVLTLLRASVVIVATIVAAATAV